MPLSRFPFDAEDLPVRGSPDSYGARPEACLQTFSNGAAAPGTSERRGAEAEDQGRDRRPELPVGRAGAPDGGRGKFVLRWRGGRAAARGGRLRTGGRRAAARVGADGARDPGPRGRAGGA